LPAVISASVPIVGDQGRVVGSLAVRLLPGANKSIDLIDAASDLDSDPALEPIQLLEDCEYAYSCMFEGTVGAITTDRPEIFSPDIPSGNSGRLRAGSHAGLLPVTVFGDNKELGTAYFEVRSRKLDYLKHYRWMLRDLTKEASSLALESFAASQQRLKSDVAGDAATAYERFALLSGLWRDPNTQAAIQLILALPHSGWALTPERRRPGHGLPISPGVVRQLMRGTPRVPWLNSPFPILSTVPAHVDYDRSEPTLDTTPNRFAKFVLRRWQGLLIDLQEVIRRRAATPAQRRGISEIGWVIAELETVLGESLFAQVGDLSFFPASDQVLQRRAGYRDLLRVYMEVEGAVQLAWTGGSEVFAAGQRDVAQLYEYWVFIQLLKLLEQMCTPVDHSGLLRQTRDGMDLDLRRGQEMAVRGRCVRLGRELELELTFNRTFSHEKSWTLAMRPDYSLRINAADDTLVAPSWVHFDAKYRIDGVEELTDLVPAGSDEDIGGSPQPKRDDLLKMHAYRDAIRSSVGAYVVFPSTSVSASDNAAFRRYHELLPGIGAFPLRPSESGDADGHRVLSDFLDHVVSHFASSLTQDRRGRYWEGTIFRDQPDAATFGWPGSWAKPPADTVVLLGYVRGQGHLEWIHSTSRYNLRADGRTGSVGLASGELGVDLVLLYGTGIETAELWTVLGQPEVWTRDQMVAHRYPRQPGAAYLCIPISRRLVDLPASVSDPANVERVRRKSHPHLAFGAPATCSLATLLATDAS
jgi:predicted component of viral defense system (DUF524 family)